MREITTHLVTGEPNRLSLVTEDQEGSGGAHHRYAISGFDTETNPSNTCPAGYKSSFSKQVILFQNGPVLEAGINGITQEVLLAILMDRLEAFQAGPYACKENQEALEHLGKAMSALQVRTVKRLARSVEGTSTL